MVESMARATVSTVVAVQAYDLVQSGQKVSVLFTAVSLTALMVSLLIPALMRHVSRGTVYVAGAAILALAAVAFTTFTIPGQLLGMLLRVVGSACLNITLSLYILDHIKRTDLVKAEPLRLALSTVSWTVGPYAGVWLYTSHGPWAPQAFSALWALLLVVIFHFLKLSVGTRARQAPNPHPLRSVRRFIAQPRLRLAWMIAFSRSCFWATFFTYAPLLLITEGMSKEAGGILVSLGNITLVTALVFGKMAQGFGVRRVIGAALLVCAGLSLLTGVSGLAHLPLLAGVLLWIGTIAASALDGVGGIPFLRAVRAHERAEMSGVYRTYLDFSDLLPNVIFSFALLYMPLAGVFIILSLWLAIAGVTAWRYLPASM